MDDRGLEPKYQELTDDEGEWIGDKLDELMGLARASGAATEYARALTPEQMDQAWAVCLAAIVPGTDDPNPIINAFGVGLGDWLVRRHRFEWKVAQDGDKSELAVLGQPGNMLMYPTNLVAKHYVAGESRFFAEVAVELDTVVARTRR